VLLQAEGRAQGDIAAAHTRGWEERAAEARAEAQQMEQSLQRALGRAQEESKAALAELAAQHEQHVESLERTWIEKQEAAIRDAVLTANDEWDLQAKEVSTLLLASLPLLVCLRPSRTAYAEGMRLGPRGLQSASREGSSPRHRGCSTARASSYGQGAGGAQGRNNALGSGEARAHAGR
jgi:hypothetical protein